MRYERTNRCSCGRSQHNRSRPCCADDVEPLDVIERASRGQRSLSRPHGGQDLRDARKHRGASNSSLPFRPPPASRYADPTPRTGAARCNSYLATSHEPRRSSCRQQPLHQAAFFASTDCRAVNGDSFAIWKSTLVSTSASPLGSTKVSTSSTAQPGSPCRLASSPTSRRFPRSLERSIDSAPSTSQASVTTGRTEWGSTERPQIAAGRSWPLQEMHALVRLKAGWDTWRCALEADGPTAVIGASARQATSSILGPVRRALASPAARVGETDQVAGTGSPSTLFDRAGPPANGMGAVALNVTVSQTDNPTIGSGR